MIVGNPPYNVGQANENDNNKNRKYAQVDQRIRETYAKASKATNKNALSDMYVKFFRWATDRLGNRDGVVCLVSNGSFLEQLAFDGMRKELAKDFTSIYVLDLGGNVRKNPKLSGTTHNVFGIQVSVAITLLVRKRQGQPQTTPAPVHFARVDEWWRKEEKYQFLEANPAYDAIPWQELTPDARGTWLTEGMIADFDTFIPMGSREAKSSTSGAEETVFKLYSRGAETTRDSWVYDFKQEKLISKVRAMMDFYNLEISRWIRSGKSKDIDAFVSNDETKIKWSSRLKEHFTRSTLANFQDTSIYHAAYRPFTKQYLYFDNIMIQRQGSFPKIFPDKIKKSENQLICLTDAGSEKPFMALAADIIADLHLVGAGAGTQCFPFYVYDEDGSNRRENITDWALGAFRAQYGAEQPSPPTLSPNPLPQSEGASREISKWDIFHYVYGLLHSPDYRARYAANLKRDLPRIPFVPAADFWRFVEAGRRLAEIHIGYESAAPHPLKHIENRAVPWTWRVEKMKLSKDKTQLTVNAALTLTEIPPAVFDYKLGNRSALEWVIDQYQVSVDKRSGIVSDPNDEDDPEAIVRLVKQVVTVSLETVRIVAGLPGLG